MRCAKCPLFSSWNNESDAGESCALFGDGWDSQFQYEDEKLKMIVGCYIERAYIHKVEREISEHYDRMSSVFLEEFCGETGF